METTTIRVGLAGFGYAGQTFHAPLLRTTPGLRIAAVSSRDPARVHAALGGDVTVLDDARALAAHDGVDLLVIASPNATHADLARTALAARKHVVVDKPFALDAAAARDLARLVRPGQVLSVFHNRRWDSSTLAAQAMLASGRLGAVRRAALHFDRFRPQPRARWREDGSAGGGIWLDLGPHLIDEALLYFGMPLAIQADIETLRPGARADDGFSARLRYADGLRVDLGASMLAAAPRPRVVLHGLRGSYVKQGLDPQEDALKAGRLPQEGARWGVDADDGVATIEQDGALRATAVPCPDGAYPEYYRRVRDAILGKGPNPVPPEQALAVMRLLDAGRLSAQERREVALD
ncbi:oxidoreductase [uncultured Massilia sp.]|uniref:oxidoreductase n=1 Tax=uncultured Massilia sp. TaxID=169973 RepID=UPI0025F0E533|nr:oxidoreductase [uncultured Massilia sp.]